MSTLAKSEASAAMLDNPIWSALTTDQAQVAVDCGAARRYLPEIGPLSGMAGPPSADGYAALWELAGAGGTLALFLMEKPRPPAGWTLVRAGTIVQMIAERPVMAGADGVETRRLTPDCVPAMVELATLTEPGPFRTRTIELGSFYGIFEAGRLVAMAGQRMSLPGFTEVSAVCTHPDARGRGYARALMARVMEEIAQAGRVPFLHSLADNHAALRVYASLGFITRQTFHLAVLQRGA